MEQLTIGTTIVYTVVIMFIAATITGVVKGISKTIIQAKKIRSGISYEEIQKEEAKKEEAKKLIERKKYESKLYCILHPLEWLNNLIILKIENIKKGKGHA